MITAIQAGDRDKDPAQTRRAMETILRDITSVGDVLLCVDQPTTMMDQVHSLDADLGLDVVSITPNYELHGSAALGYAWEELITKSTQCVMLSGESSPSGMDRDFWSYCTFYGRELLRTVVDYERITVQ